MRASWNQLSSTTLSPQYARMLCVVPLLWWQHIVSKRLAEFIARKSCVPHRIRWPQNIWKNPERKWRSAQWHAATCCAREFRPGTANAIYIHLFICCQQWKQPRNAMVMMFARRSKTLVNDLLASCVTAWISRVPKWDFDTLQDGHVTFVDFPAISAPAYVREQAERDHRQLIEQKKGLRIFKHIQNISKLLRSLPFRHSAIFRSCCNFRPSASQVQPIITFVGEFSASRQNVSESAAVSILNIPESTLQSLQMCYKFSVADPGLLGVFAVYASHQAKPLSDPSWW